jgi:RHS repeat-associated protein
VYVTDDHRVQADSFWVKLDSVAQSGVHLKSISNSSQQATGVLHLHAGVNVVTARICDFANQCVEGHATYIYNAPPPLPQRGTPIPSLSLHQPDHREPSPFDATLGYATPSYVSLDVPRSLGLAYSSEQAAPTGFVQVDVDAHSAEAPNRMSIRVRDAAGQWVRFTNGQTENFYAGAPGVSRLSAQWDASALATGAYAYTVVVRNWWGNVFQDSTISARVLVLNDDQSPLGRGWSVAGLARLHPQGDSALVMDEGDGAISYFARASCDTAGCAYTSPAGDFSVLTQVITRDGAGAVTGVEYRRRLLNGTLLLFQSDGRLTAVRDRYGNETGFGYDGAGRLTAVTDPVGRSIALGYAADHLSTITDPGGRITHALVDRDGDLVQVTDPDGVAALRAHYDHGRLLQQWDRAGSGWGLEYDAAGKLAASVAPQFTTFEGEAVRSTTRYRSWEAAHLPTSGSGGFSAPAPRVDPAEAGALVIGPKADTTRVAFDRWASPAVVVDPRGRVSTWERNGVGQLIHATSPDDGRTSYVWSGPDLIRVTDEASGTTAEIIYEQAYHQPEREWVGDVLLRRSFYGSLGQLDSVRVDSVVTRYTYDARGRILTGTDPEGLQTTVTYDSAGAQNTRTVTIAGPGIAQRVTAYAYDAFGRTRTLTDPAARVFTAAYDALNRIVASIGPAADTLRYGYDDRARTDTIIDPEGQRYVTAWNPLGWVEHRVDPRGGVERFAYDRAGNLAVYTNRRLQQVRYTYDALDRPLTRVAGTDTTEYGYDPDERWTVVRNAESTDTLYTDASSRPTRASTERGNLKLSLESTYTLEGLRNELIASGPSWTHSVGYGYDEMLRLDYLRDLRGTATGIHYNRVQLPDTVTLPTGSTATDALKQSFSYTATRLPERIDYSRAAAAVAFGRSYGYDGLERIERIAWPSAYDETETRFLGYDLSGRLTHYTDVHGWEEQQMVCDDPPQLDSCHMLAVAHTDTLRAEAYSYDAVGNRTDRGAVVEAGNRLTHFDGYTLEYDADGNLTHKYLAADSLQLNQRYHWNALGQLAEVTRNGVTTDFGYDGLGRRVRKSTEGTTTRYLWDGNQLVMELDSAGAPIREYAFYPGIDSPHSVRRSSDGAIFYYAMEAPGQVTGLVSANNEVAAEYAYTPWGEPLSESGSVDQPLRYGAREYDGETGLYSFRARYYDAELGRFISEDPIGLAGGINPYAYVGDDPVNFTDPSGMGGCVSALMELQVVDQETAEQLCSAGGTLAFATLPGITNTWSGSSHTRFDPLQGVVGGSLGGGGFGFRAPGGGIDGRSDPVQPIVNALNSCAGRWGMAIASVALDVGLLVSGEEVLTAGAKGLAYLGRAALNGGRTELAERVFAQVAADRAFAAAGEHLTEFGRNYAGNFMPMNLAFSGLGVIASGQFSLWDLAPFKGSYDALREASSACPLQ